MEKKNLQLPLTKETIATLRAGDTVYLTGELLTARDAAHGRMKQTLRDWEDEHGRAATPEEAAKILPVDIRGETIYYLGPTPAREGRVIGSAGPTTSSRMDAYTPELMDLGLAACIGKGKRSAAVIDAIARNGGTYFAAVGGAGALLSKCIVAAEVVAYEDLGTEAIRRLRVEDFPVIVIVDGEGTNWYEKVQEKK